MSPVAEAPARSGAPLEMRWLTAAGEWQSRAVVARHLRVYLHNWHTAFLPPVGEPVTMLLAFGLGLGGYVANLAWHGRPVTYTTYVAPGLLAYAAFMTAVFQALFAAFIRMRYQRTWEGQLTTQVELRHVVWGEVLWAALLATIYVAIVAGVLACFALLGLVDLEPRGAAPDAPRRLRRGLRVRGVRPLLHRARADDRPHEPAGLPRRDPDGAAVRHVLPDRRSHPCGSLGGESSVPPGRDVPRDCSWADPSPAISRPSSPCPC